MKSQTGAIALGVVLAAALAGCHGGSLGASEPSESDMRDAMLYEMNHPPGVAVSDPITIKFFKKEACDAPTGQGYHCTFDVQVASANLAAGFYNDIPGGNFYKDSSGKWQMRPPF
jgi:hypothetical protein